MNVPSIVISKAGPLPLSQTFSCSGSTQVFQVSGSAWSQGQPTLIGANILIDGANVGTCVVWCNVNTSHMALISQPVITHLPAGSHTIQLTALNGATITDLNDRFNVLMSDLG